VREFADRVEKHSGALEQAILPVAGRSD